MSVNLDGMFQLHELDVQILRLRRELAKGPRAIAAAEAELQTATSTAETAAKTVQLLKRDVELKNLDVQGRQEGMLKHQGQLNQAKTNVEYQGLVNQIETEKRAINKIEEEILGLWEQIEANEAIKAESIEKQKTTGEALAKTREVTGAESAKLQGELDGLEADRAGIAKDIASDQLNFYERALERHKGAAMAEVAKDGTCQGCYMVITANEQSKLLGGNELLICRTCQRILYLER